jgi:hypothetical protein
MNKYTKELSFGNKYESLPADATDEDYRTKRTPHLCHKYKLSYFFRNYIKEKYSESEASILLLAHIEKELKDARKELRKVERLARETDERERSHSTNYRIDHSRIVYKEAIEENTKNAKIWRKKVKDIKASPEYLWEQLMR